MKLKRTLITYKSPITLTIHIQQTPTLSQIGWSNSGQLMSGLFKPDLSLNTCTEKKTLRVSEKTFIEDPVEEGAAMIQRAFRPPTPRVFGDRANPLAFPDEYLWERYRLNRPSVVYQCTLQGPRLSETTQRSKALTIVQSVFIALQFLFQCRWCLEIYLALKLFLNIFVTFPGCHHTQRSRIHYM